MEKERKGEKDGNEKQENGRGAEDFRGGSKNTENTPLFSSSTLYELARWGNCSYFTDLYHERCIAQESTARDDAPPADESGAPTAPRRAFLEVSEV
ncbi:hypothetical protein G5I_08713 [Acromyrmex echinatior]|uniref:Uncharacterized protein n=1 Tax=Acromyrmex echinatior TaxID=103372 RepID=F4WS97_ACREC|nr:hypothetical protein G5I_08713 [Acromyrmex echinatior]